MQELYHHGIIGMHWGVRRFQNADGSLTPAGERRLRKQVKQIEKADSKWAKKNYKKIYDTTYKKSRAEINDYVNNDLDKRMQLRTSSGKISSNYINNYNRKLASLMNKNVGDLRAPSGRAVQFVAKRGNVGVEMALTTSSFDMSTVKNGVYESGRIAYRKKVVDRV